MITSIFTFLSFLPLFISCGSDHADIFRESALNEKASLQEIVESRKIPKKDLKIVIRKAKRTLSVSWKDEVLITYSCVLGFEPEGDKMQEGDGRTPEGNFSIKAMYPHKSWSYFIWFDYPNDISRQRFSKRKADGTIPKNARIGGDIGIHGVPEGRNDLIAKSVDWTLGCISLTTENITDLYHSIGAGTKIEILK